MNSPDIHTVAREALARADTLAATLLPGGRRRGREYVCASLAGGNGQSCSLNLDTGRWSDFATGEKGTDLVGLYAAARGLNQGEAARALAQELGLSNGDQGRPQVKTATPAWTPILPVPDDAPAPTFQHFRLGVPVASWPYLDGQGRVLGHACRFEAPEGKEILPMTYGRDGAGKRTWKWKSFPDPRPLYGLDRLAKTAPDVPVLIVEGEKTADAAQRLLPSMAAMTWPGGCKAVAKADFTPLAGRTVFVWPDSDRPGIKAADDVAGRALAAGAEQVFIVENHPDAPEGWDIADGEVKGMTPADALAWIEKHHRAYEARTATNDNLPTSPPRGRDYDDPEPPRGSRITRALDAAVTLDVFESMEIKPRPFIIEGLLRQGESAMFFAKTGVGKTYLAMQLAMGATREGEVLGPYSTVAPCGVLYVDAEMSAADMQARVRNLAIKADGKRFHLLSSELLASVNQAVPNLDEEWRPAILDWLTQHSDIGLVVLDNLSSLTPGVAEDKRLDWDAINQWIIELRRRGLSVILVHHAGKGGDQRGTSAREDQLNLTLKLTALDDRTTTAFRVDFQKARGLSGEQKKPFVVELVEDEHGRINLVHKNLNDEMTAQVAFLASEGMKQNEIKDKLDISQAGVSRRLKRAESDGLLVVRGAGPEKTYHLTDLGRAATIGMDAEAV